MTELNDLPIVRAWRMKDGSTLAIWNHVQWRWEYLGSCREDDELCKEICIYEPEYYNVKVVGDVNRGIAQDIKRKIPLGPDNVTNLAEARKEAQENLKREKRSDNLWIESRKRGRVIFVKDNTYQDVELPE